RLDGLAHGVAHAVRRKVTFNKKYIQGVAEDHSPMFIPRTGTVLAEAERAAEEARWLAVATTGSEDMEEEESKSNTMTIEAPRASDAHSEAHILGVSSSSSPPIAATWECRICDGGTCGGRRARELSAQSGPIHRGQQEGTRSRTLIDGVQCRVMAFADKYCSAWRAKLALTGPGAWEAELWPLLDGDIRSYVDAEVLDCQNARAARNLERGVISDGNGNVTMGDEGEMSNPTLTTTSEDRRRGTGETRWILSWIWTTVPLTEGLL
ncbi:hypothetical protein BJ138DRAFT_1108265, partial [Hygrophoropsis aurantiaca]